MKEEVTNLASQKLKNMYTKSCDEVKEISFVISCQTIAERCHSAVARQPPWTLHRSNVCMDELLFVVCYTVCVYLAYIHKIHMNACKVRNYHGLIFFFMKVRKYRKCQKASGIILSFHTEIFLGLYHKMVTCSLTCSFCNAAVWAECYLMKE